MGINGVGNDTTTNKIEIGTTVQKKDASETAKQLLYEYSSECDENMGLAVESSTNSNEPAPAADKKVEGESLEGFYNYIHEKIGLPKNASLDFLTEQDLKEWHDLYQKELEEPKQPTTAKTNPIKPAENKAKRSNPEEIGTYKNDKGTFYAKPKLNANGDPESFTAYKVNTNGEPIGKIFRGTYGRDGEVIINSQNDKDSLKTVDKDYLKGAAMAAKEYSAGNIAENEQFGTIFFRTNKNQLTGLTPEGGIIEATDGIQRGSQYGDIKLKKTPVSEKSKDLLKG